MKQMVNKFYFFVLGLVFVGQSDAWSQITLTPNVTDTKYVQATSSQYARLTSAGKNLKTTAAITTGSLGLPFSENFLTYTFLDSLPKSDNWQNHSGVRINNNTYKNAPNYYAASFDGQDSAKVAYTGYRGDSLISKPIDLSAYKPKDRISLRFVYQAGGYGKIPSIAAGDSISLQFGYVPDSLGYKYKKDTVVWKNVWVQVGSKTEQFGKNFRNDTSKFRSIQVLITDSVFYQSGFRFKFQSFGTSQSEFGVWHIDNIYINEGYLNLPFFDDFSENKPQNHKPRTDLWMSNSGVQINNNYALSAPTVNVATFDGTDKSSVPYNGYSFAQGLGDSLVSKPVVLNGLTAASNVRLSFYYECGGRGDLPDYKEGDSIVLSFKYSYIPDSIPGIKYNKDTLVEGWKTVWSQSGCNGKPDSLKVNDKTSFLFVTLPVDSVKYFHEAFQFKFKAYGRQSGNFDAWHLDYVYLDKNRLNNDTNQYLSDRSLNEFVKKPFKYYTAVPYKHYYKNSAAFLNDTISFTASNLSINDNPLVVGSIVIRDLLSSGQVNDSITNLPKGYFQPISAKEIGYLAPLPVATIKHYADSLSVPVYSDTIFRAQEILTRIRLVSTQEVQNGAKLGIDLTQNNSVDCITRLYDYYAFDDGVPEYSAELGGKGALLAYKYVIPVKDTITAIDINFSHNIRDNSGEQFKLVIWKRLSLTRGQQDSIIYMSDNKNVRYDDTISTLSDGFARYPLNIANIGTAIVQDTIYIGYKQTSIYQLQIGYDYDENASGIDKIYTNGTAQPNKWLPLIGVKGHLLMRPVFGTYTNSVKNITYATGPPSDYPGGPNPTNGVYTLYGVKPVTSSLTSASGQTQTVISNTVNDTDTEYDLSAYPAGFYILRYQVGNSWLSKKISKN